MKINKRTVERMLHKLYNTIKDKETKRTSSIYDNVKWNIYNATINLDREQALSMIMGMLINTPKTEEQFLALYDLYIEFTELSIKEASSNDNISLRQVHIHSA